MEQDPQREAQDQEMEEVREEVTILEKESEAKKADKKGTAEGEFYAIMPTCGEDY